jgi:hypothetical protein
MKKAALILSLLVVLLAATGAMAEVRLYLYSRVAPVTDKLTVDDIARIEGSARECADIGGLTIERDILADDYIDRDELSKLVSGHVEGPFFIFGSAVRVDSPEETADESGEKIAGARSFAAATGLRCASVKRISRSRWRDGP